MKDYKQKLQSKVVCDDDKKRLHVSIEDANITFSIDGKEKERENIQFFDEEKNIFESLSKYIHNNYRGYKFSISKCLFETIESIEEEEANENFFELEELEEI